LIALEKEDVIAVLIGGEQEIPGRINCKITGSGAQGRLTASIGQFSIFTNSINSNIEAW
jgi:hypothetical protein